MKKIVFAGLVFFAAFGSANASSGTFGFSFGLESLSSGNNYGDIGNNFYDSLGGSWTPNNFFADSSGGNLGIPDAGIFYERTAMFGLSENSVFGIKLGYTLYEENSFDYPANQYTFTGMNTVSLHGKSEAYAIPLSVYYAYAVGSRWRFSGGAGLSFLTSKFSSYTDNLTFGGSDALASNQTDTIVIPTINAGIEFLLSSVFGIYADLGYNIGGKVSAPTGYGNAERDFSGASFKIGINVRIPSGSGSSGISAPGSPGVPEQDGPPYYII